MKLRIMKNKLLIRIPSAKERKVGNIIIPTTVSLNEQHLVGEVMEIGEGKTFKKGGNTFPMDYNLGDKVVVGKFAGTRLHIDDKLYMLVDAKEIMGIFSENTPE